MRSRTSTCKNKRRWKSNVLQIHEVSMNINVEFWSVFFLLEYRARISENLFEIGELALCMQIPLKLYGNQSQCQIMNLDLMFSMKPVNITFILPNNFNCFLSVLETLLTIPRYEKHFIVNPRCLNDFIILKHQLFGKSNLQYVSWWYKDGSELYAQNVPDW